MTEPHKRLIRILNELQLRHIEEEPFHPYWIDCYLPEFHIGIEADGPYHLSKSDGKRDKLLMERYSLPILRINHKDLGTTKKREAVKDRIIQFIEKWYQTTEIRVRRRFNPAD